MRSIISGVIGGAVAVATGCLAGLSSRGSARVRSRQRVLGQGKPGSRVWACPPFSALLKRPSCAAPLIKTVSCSEHHAGVANVQLLRLYGAVTGQVILENRNLRNLLNLWNHRNRSIRAIVVVITAAWCCRSGSPARPGKRVPDDDSTSPVTSHFTLSTSQLGLTWARCASVCPLPRPNDCRVRVLSYARTRQARES